MYFKTVVRQFAMAASKLNLNGVYTALITPFTSSGEIDFGKVEHNVKKFESEVDQTGYAVGGSNSEVASLTPSERVELIKRVRKLIKPERMILGGATAESTKLAIEMSKAMADVGANGLLVMTPHYFRANMTNEAIIRHFESLADASPIPIVIYNSPMVAGIDLSIEVLTKLADHPNIRGVKDFDIRKMAMTVQQTKGKNFDVMAASAGYLLPAMQMGCSGGIVVLSGPLGPEVCKLASLAKEKKWDEAICLQKKIIPIDILFYGVKHYGVPGVKATMELKGFESGYCRPPLIDLSEKDKNDIKQYLEKYGFL